MHDPENFHPHKHTTVISRLTEIVEEQLVKFLTNPEINNLLDTAP